MPEPGSQAAVRPASTPSSWNGDTFDDPEAFLHARVTLYLRVLFTMISALYVVGWVVLYASGFDAVTLHRIPAKLAHLASAVALGLIWRWVAAGRRREAVLRSVELVVSMVIAGLVSLVMFVLPDQVPASIMLTGAMAVVAMVLVLRAAVVPSTAHHAVVVGVLCTGAVSATSAANYTGPSIGGIAPAALGAALPVLFLSLFTAVSAVVSATVYGLQAGIRRAQQFGQYTLLEKIGEGGMGAVYRARHALLRRPTAVKLLPQEKSGATSVARFEREVQHTALLTHPNTVSIYDFGRTRGGVFYYAMEYLEGLTLEELVAHDGPQPASRVVFILEQIAGALSEAHEAGLVHRDVKPANVILCQRGGIHDVAKVLDFGLVKSVDTPTDGKVTGANVVAGTPQYLAPEALTHPEQVDARADIYALGAVAYFLLAGEDVFDGGTMVEICSHHLHTTPRPFAERGVEVPADLEAVVLRCLAKSPAERFAHGAELHEALLGCASHGTWRSNDASRWWRDHGSSVKAPRSAPVPVSDRPMTIALPTPDAARTLDA